MTCCGRSSPSAADTDYVHLFSRFASEHLFPNQMGTNKRADECCSHFASVSRACVLPPDVQHKDGSNEDQTHDQDGNGSPVHAVRISHALLAIHDSHFDSRRVISVEAPHASAGSASRSPRGSRGGSLRYFALLDSRSRRLGTSRRRTWRARTRADSRGTGRCGLQGW